MYRSSSLLDVLKNLGVDPLTLERAEKEAEQTGRLIRSVLINDGIVTEDQLTEASAEAYGFHFVDLVDYPIDPAAMAKIPLPLVLRHKVLDLSMTDTELVVASPTRGTSSRWTTSAPQRV